MEPPHRPQAAGFFPADAEGKLLAAARDIERAEHPVPQGELGSEVPVPTPPRAAWALIFLVIAGIAALLGFCGIAGVAADIAKVLLTIALALFALFLILGIVAAKKVT